MQVQPAQAPLWQEAAMAAAGGEQPEKCQVQTEKCQVQNEKCQVKLRNVSLQLACLPVR
jgi:hypothetical protein